MDHYVFLIASQRHGNLEVGVTDNLVRSMHEHRGALTEGFALRHGPRSLVWFSVMPSAQAAVRRQEEIRNWKREWKLALIEEENPRWIDLYPGLLGFGLGGGAGAMTQPVSACGPESLPARRG